MLRDFVGLCPTTRGRGGETQSALSRNGLGFDRQDESKRRSESIIGSCQEVSDDGLADSQPNARVFHRNDNCVCIAPGVDAQKTSPISDATHGIKAMDQQIHDHLLGLNAIFLGSARRMASPVESRGALGDWGSGRTAGCHAAFRNDHRQLHVLP